ncbi:MAG: hypothetical protein OXR84_07495 [Magnetovibrio sp.]|nr:hypothetical protein [Magnetovibrio sp.]
MQLKFVSEEGRLALHPECREAMANVSPWMRHALFHQVCQQIFQDAPAPSAAGDEMRDQGFTTLAECLSASEAATLSDAITQTLEARGPNAGAHAPVSDDPAKINVDVPQTGRLRELLLDALPRILNPRVEAALETYYGSHFRIFSSVTYRTHALAEHVNSFRWHRDMAPMAQVHIITYLTPSGVDSGATMVLDLAQSLAAARQGYRYEQLHERTVDLAEIFGGAEAAPAPSRPDLAAGDALLFAPPRVLHRGSLPTTGYRDTFTLVVLPSSVPWRHDVADFGDDLVFRPTAHMTLCTDPFRARCPEIPGEFQRLTSVTEDWVLGGGLQP